MNDNIQLLSVHPLSVEDCLHRMNEIQRSVYCGLCTRNEKQEFRAYSRKVSELGYTLHKRSLKNSLGRKIGVEWYATRGEHESRNTECEWIRTDVRPEDGIRTLKGDCTTRAMAFCLEGIMTYREIESRQYLLAAQRHTRRNTTGTWEIVICEKGWMRVNLMSGIKRSRLATLLKGHLTKPCISRSSGHVAAIDTDGRVRDTWDSRGGKVVSLYVFGDDYGAVDNTLGRCGIRCQPILNPKVWTA